MKQSDQNKDDHRRDIEHPDRWNDLLKRDHDRVRYSHYEREKRLASKYEPLREKSDKNKEHQNAQKPVEDKADKQFRIAGNDTSGEPVDNEERVPNYAGGEIRKDQSDKDRNERSESRIDTKIRQETSRRIDPFFSQFSDLETEAADRAERIRIGVVKYQAQDHECKEDKKQSPKNHPNDRINRKTQHISIVISLTEDRCANTDHRSSFFDRHFEIMTHSHR